MGVNSHTNYALRKNGLQEITPIHPELEEPLGRSSSHTYGLIVYQEQVRHGAQILAGYTLGQAPTCSAGPWARRRRRSWTRSTARSGRAAGNAATPHEATQAVWDVLVPFSGYAFNKAHSAGVRPGLLLDRLPQGELPGRVHGRAAHLGRGRQGQVRALPGRVPPHGDQGAAARRQPVGGDVHRRRPRHPVRPGRDPQRGDQRRRRDRRHPQVQGQTSPASPISCARCRSWSCATSGSSSR